MKTSDAQALGQLTSEQQKDAATITTVGKSLGASARDIAVAIMTALDESSLNNLSGGDRDSAGLFQQRPSAGWGSYAQVTNPVYSSTQFFRHLLAVGNRNSMSPWMEAQTVQVSAFPDGSNYERFWSQAQGIAAAELGMSPAQLAAATGGAATDTLTAGGSGAQSWSPLGGITSSALNGVYKIVLKAAFTGLGLTLIVLGLYTAGKNA